MKPIDDLTFKKFVEDNFPSPYNSIEKWKDYINEKTLLHLRAFDIVKPVVEDIVSSLCKKYRKEEKRVFAEIIYPSSVYPNPHKSHERIVEKIMSQPKGYTLQNFDTKMEDIARFRIVCNYLSDIFELVKELTADSHLNDCCKISEKDYIIEDRNNPHRAFHLILKVPVPYKDTNVVRKVELQIMTKLQEAWDKKDHNLVYEKIRIGKRIDKKDRIKMASMSDLLYIADEFFDDLREKMLKEKSEE